MSIDLTEWVHPENVRSMGRPWRYLDTVWASDGCAMVAVPAIGELAIIDDWYDDKMPSRAATIMAKAHAAVPEGQEWIQVAPMAKALPPRKSLAAGLSEPPCDPWPGVSLGANYIRRMARLPDCRIARGDGKVIPFRFTGGTGCVAALRP